MVAAAPEGLELVRAFVNTHDLEEGTDELAEPAAATRWLADRALLAPDHALTRADLARLADVREALAAMLAANHERAGPPAQARAVVEAAADRSRLTLRFDGARTVLAPRAKGVDAVIGRLLVLVAAAMRDGTWQRLKVCRNDACRWAFYDASRNRSGKWCSMAVCGNRTKVRAFRARTQG